MGVFDRIQRGNIPSPFLPVTTGGGGGSTDVAVEYHTLSAPEIAAKQFTLADTPETASEVLIDLIGGSSQIFAVDFTVSGSVVDWTGLALDGQVIAGDILRVVYLTASSSTDLKVEYRTLSAPEVAAFALTLADTPATAGEVRVDLIGGSSQIYSVDFTVSGATLDWTGLGLAGQVIAGDILRIVYEV